MNRLLVSAAVLGLISSSSAFAQAGPTSTTQGTADAIVVDSIQVTPTDGTTLNFGRIAAEAGTVTVNANGTFSSSPAMIVDDTNIGAASFDVTGTPGLAYSADIDTTVTLTGSLGGTMTASLTPSGTGAVSSSLDGTTGADQFSVGGTLTVANEQTPGTYQGSFDVTVRYD